ncbi:phage holin family protein [Tetragenococcus muriaticus]|uniref:Uncharacterized protein n=1 Tax=Tetragenococcus muriaticus 3MR10-3 TaxID=1302648 RepID=A0A091C140_9ENTE|nr:membrane protein of unknown function [Tetragenococcus muriaticus 3MR10-3]
MSYFERLVVNMLTFISLSVLLPQMVHVESFLTALLASFVLSILNMVIKTNFDAIVIAFDNFNFWIF